KPGPGRHGRLVRCPETLLEQEPRTDQENAGEPGPYGGFRERHIDGVEPEPRQRDEDSVGDEEGDRREKRPAGHRRDRGADEKQAQRKVEQERRAHRRSPPPSTSLGASGGRSSVARAMSCATDAAASTASSQT